MEAALSDNSAPPFVASGPTRKDGPITLVYAFQYRATSAAQKLLVKYTLGEDFAGNVTLQAATLAMAPADVK